MFTLVLLFTCGVFQSQEPAPELDEPTVVQIPLQEASGKQEVRCGEWKVPSGYDPELRLPHPTRVSIPLDNSRNPKFIGLSIERRGRWTEARSDTSWEPSAPTFQIVVKIARFDPSDIPLPELVERLASAAYLAALSKTSADHNGEPLNSETSPASQVRGMGLRGADRWLGLQKIVRIRHFRWLHLFFYPPESESGFVVWFELYGEGEEGGGDFEEHWETRKTAFIESLTLPETPPDG